MAASDVAIAERSRIRGEQDEQRHDDDPAADTEQRPEEPRREADEDEAHRPILRAWTADHLLARLAEQPRAAAVLLDVDGTLAPIVDRPEEARVPPADARDPRRARRPLRARRLPQRTSGRGRGARRRRRRRPLRRRARPRARAGSGGVGRTARRASRGQSPGRPRRASGSRSRSTTGRPTTRPRPSEALARSPSGRWPEGLRPAGADGARDPTARSTPTRARPSRSCSPKSGRRPGPVRGRRHDRPRRVPRRSTASSSPSAIAVRSDEAPERARRAADLVVDGPEGARRAVLARL